MTSPGDNEPPPASTGPLADAVQAGLREYGDRELTDPRPCPDCGERDYRKHDFVERTFAVLLTDDGPEEVTVRYRRFRCRSCDRTVPADLSDLFYEDCRYGRPIVDLCVRLAAGRSDRAVADLLASVGVRVTRDTVGRYVEVVGGTGDGGPPTDESLGSAVRATILDGASVGDADGRAAGDAGDPATERLPEDGAGAEDARAVSPSEDPPEAALEALDRLQRRRDLVATLRAGPYPKDELVSEAHHARSTVERALSELEETGFVEHAPEGYVATVAGRLAAERHDELLDATCVAGATAGDDVESEVAVVRLLARRLAVLDRLRAAPHHKPALVEATGTSRSTVDRAIQRLADAGYVERRSEGFAATPAGREAAARFRSFLADLDAILDARAVLAPLPHDASVPASAVTEARAVTAEPRYRLFEALADRLDGAVRYDAVLPRVVDTRHVRLVHARVPDADLRVELHADGAVLSRLREELPHVVSELAAADTFTARECDPPPFAVLLVDATGTGRREDDAPAPAGRDDPPAGDDGSSAGRSPTVFVVTFDDDVAGFLATDAAAAVEWAAGLCADTAADGRPATEELVSAPAAADLPPLTGERLPPRLRSQGFVRVDEALLADAEPTDPATAWRAGLGFAEVHAGYAAERRSEDGPLAADLAASLSGGGAVAILGPPGSGKSTVCKRVAVDWAVADRGPVLYRESGRGEPFEAPGALAAVLERCPGEALVVVEDGVRPDADAVFDVLEMVAGREDVAVLLDAREREWLDPEGPVDARRAGVRRDHVAVTHVPPVDEAECERLVAHVESVTGEPVGVTPEDLLADVRRAADRHDVGEEGAAPGGVFLLFHRLARYLDPLAAATDGEAPTSLDEHVDRVRAELADIGDGALDAALLVNVLNAAGLAVDPAYVHAVATDGDYDAVRDALDCLEGEVLFPATGDATYRTIHATWSVEFLARLLDAEGEPAATERFGRAVTALLSLADDPDRRAAVAREVVDPAVLERVAAEPAGWVEGTVERLLGLGRERPKLAPLYVAGDGLAADLPAARPPDLDARSRVRLGRMLLDAGEYDRAERAFRGLDGEAFAGERLLGLSEAARERGDYGTARERATACLDHARQRERLDLRARARAALGRVATRRGEYRTARAHLQQALVTFDHLGDRGREALTVGALGTVAAEEGAYEDARECHRRALAVHEDREDRHAEADALRNLARVAWELGDVGTAREHERRSLALHRALGDRHGAARSLGNLGMLAQNAGDFEAAREYYRRALDLHRALGDRHGEADQLTCLGLLARAEGDHEQAREYCRRGLDVYRDVGDRHGEARCLANLGVVAHHDGDYEAAREHYGRSIELFREVGAREDEAHNRLELGDVARCRGDYEAAREHLRRSRELYEDIGTPSGVADSRLRLGLVARARGELETAVEHLGESLDVVEELGLDRRTARVLVKLARTARLGGDLDAAVEHTRRSLDVAEGLDDWRTECEAHSQRAAALACRGRLEAARAHVSEALDVVPEEGTALPTAEVGLVAAAVDRERGARRSAAEHLSDALAVYRDVGQPYDVVRCRLGLARLARDEGAVAEATDHADAAREAARDLGASHLAVDAAVELAACARRRGDRDDAHLGNDADAHLEEALATARDAGYRPGEVRALRERGWLARERGDLDAARDDLRESREAAAETGHRLAELSARVGLGAVALDRGAPARAREHLEAAAEGFREAGATPRALDALDHLVEACEAAGDGEAAVEWCDVGVEVAEEADDSDRAATFRERRGSLAGTAADD